MSMYICLFKEIELLNKDLNKYKKGLITYEELKQRLINISHIVDYLLDV